MGTSGSASYAYQRMKEEKEEAEEEELEEEEKGGSLRLLMWDQEGGSIELQPVSADLLFPRTKVWTDPSQRLRWV